MKNINKNITALYIRVSTDFQAEKGYSIEAQQDKLKTYCELNGLNNYEFYIDAGFSGSNLDRPSMQKLLSDIKSNKIQTVIVLKLDRLSRRTKDTLYLIEDVFNTNDIRFISLTENLDTYSSNGKFFITIMSSVAQLERENIRERTMMGTQKKAEKGVKSASPKILVGYDYDSENNRFISNENEANQVRLIFKMYTDGMGLNYINRYMKNSGYSCRNVKWGDVKQIHNILDNPTYTGKVFRFRGSYIPANNVEQIIDEETFNKAQAMRMFNKEKHKRLDSSRFLLTGLMRCGYCGAPLRGYPAKYIYYACYSRTANHPHVYYADSCEQRYHRANIIDNYIINEIKRLSESEIEFNKVKEIVTDNNMEISLLQNEIIKIDKKISRLYDLYIDESLSKDILDKKLVTLNKSKNNILDKINALNKPIIKSITAPDYNQFKSLTSNFDNLNMDEKRKVLFLIIEKIFIYNDHIVIKWKF